jgi:hypothetical protein
MLDTVTQGILDAGKGRKIPIGSDHWGLWLSAHKRFKIETANDTVSVYNINGSWVAQKRIAGQLRQKRLGATDAIAKMPWHDLVIVADGLLSENWEQEKQSRDPDHLRELLAQTQSNSQKAIAILTDALSLKANAGGAIKTQIRQALAILEDA